MYPTTECPAEDCSLGEILVFALTYNGYKRLGAGPEHLSPVVRPVLNYLESHGTPPPWAGLDLLRGTLFYIQRRTHHWGDVPPGQERHMRALVSSIRERAGSRVLVADESV